MRTIEFVAEIDDVFYVRTTQDAPNAQLIAVPATSASARTGASSFRRRAYRADRASASSAARIIAQYLQDAHSVVRVFDLNGKRALRREAAGSRAGRSASPATSTDGETFFAYTDFLTPTSISRLDVATGEVERVPRAEARRRHQRRIVTEQVFYRSKDGTRVPMFITQQARPRQERPDAAACCTATAASTSRSSRRSACPCWCGSKWAASTRSPICAAARSTARRGTAPARSCRSRTCSTTSSPPREWLIDEKYTSTPKLAIRGRSNGGLLVGAVLTQRPDLFGAALPAVGVLDMLRYHTPSANARQWSSDYGLSENEAEFRAQYAYSPVHNVQPGHVLSADARHDGRSRRSRRALAQLQVRGRSCRRRRAARIRCCCEWRRAPVTAPASRCGCRSRTSPTSGRSWSKTLHMEQEQAGGVRLKPTDQSASAAGRASARLSVFASSASSSVSTASPGIACCSAAHAPRSMSLQRSLQNGRQGELSRPLDGPRRRWGSGTRRHDAHVQTVSWNFTSSVVCAGRAFRSVQRRKRMLQR